MPEEQETELEDNLGEEPDEVIPFQYTITSYGADYPVDGLVKRMRDGDIFVPSFQRGYVWTMKQASRFVESLILGLPVPGVFLSKEQETQKLLVIDGQQRLRSLQFFYDGIFAETGREFSLRSVQKQFGGATYRKLSDEDRRRLDDSIIHATIVKQDVPSEDDSSIYYIFERLNTGGTLLTPQEIRACIYHGQFNELLKELNKNQSWREVYGPVSSRMRDQELILRFLALYFDMSRYERPMKEFLNSYMGRNRHLRIHPANRLTDAFANTIGVVENSLGKAAFKPKRALNAAVFDAVMVGIARRLEKDAIHDPEALRRTYRTLVDNEDFVKASSKATADEESVRIRMSLATASFADIP
jgi:hypothetical protein